MNIFKNILKKYYLLLINFWINKNELITIIKNVFVLNPYLQKEQNLIGWKLQIRDKSSY